MLRFFEYLSSLLRCPSDRLVPLTAGSRHAGAVASPACLVAMIWMSSKKNLWILVFIGILPHFTCIAVYTHEYRRHHRDYLELNTKQETSFFFGRPFFVK